MIIFNILWICQTHPIQGSAQLYSLAGAESCLGQDCCQVLNGLLSNPDYLLYRWNLKYYLLYYRSSKKHVSRKNGANSDAYSIVPYNKLWTFRMTTYMFCACGDLSGFRRTKTDNSLKCKPLWQSRKAWRFIFYTFQQMRSRHLYVSCLGKKHERRFPAI